MGTIVDVIDQGGVVIVLVSTNTGIENVVLEDGAFSRLLAAGGRQILGRACILHGSFPDQTLELTP